MKIKIKINGSENASYYGVSTGTVVEEDFEKYVAAVVASEIGNAPLEACKAQAVASRTFAYRYLYKGTTISDSGSSAQSYRAKRYSESYKTCILAAEETKGLILTYDGRPADTYFSHSNGGTTTSSAERWGGIREYLVSKPDKWDAATHVNKIGHGVGMSQVGATYAAEHGVKFKDILTFYYPGTTFSTISENEGGDGMITLEQFLDGLKQNAARIKGYKLSHNGSDGYSDCIGFIIGGLALKGQKWGGTHGSNYAKRYRTKNFHSVTDASQLKLGDIVYKAYLPGHAKYDLPSKYMSSGDLKDYYHVGAVTSVNPLVISHCSGGGMHYDNKIGAWKYAGDCSLVDYSARGSIIPETTPAPKSEDISVSTGKMVVDVPDDTTVNVRTSASTSGKVIARLDEGTSVDVVSSSGSWSKINYSFTKSGTGYIMSKFIVNGKIDVPDDTSVNVRSKASTSASRITTIPEGGSVNVLSTSGSWSRVEYSVSKNGTGYVMSKFLKKG